MKPIPIIEAEHLAKIYGADQIIIYARKANYRKTLLVAKQDQMVVYGKNKKQFNAIAQVANYIKYQVFGWIKENEKENS